MYCDFTIFFLFQKGINSGSIIPLANNTTRPASRVTSPLNVGRELENFAEKLDVPGERRMSNYACLQDMIGKIQDNIANNEEFVHEKFNCLDCSIEHKLQTVHEKFNSKFNSLEHKLQSVHEKLNNLENMQVFWHQNFENLLQKLIDEKLAIVKNQITGPENHSEV